VLAKEMLHSSSSDCRVVQCHARLTSTQLPSPHKHPLTLWLCSLQGRGGEDWGIDLAQALEAALVGSQAAGEAKIGVVRQCQVLACMAPAPDCLSGSPGHGLLRGWGNICSPIRSHQIATIQCHCCMSGRGWCSRLRLAVRSRQCSTSAALIANSFQCPYVYCLQVAP
jgi:hypothetical protein